MWDSVVSAATKAATQAGEATQTAATKTKLHADLLLIDRDVNARKEKFGVDMYAHLEQITSTQEFYVADDRLINVIRPTLIKAQREVAAYERKRDTLKGKVNLAEANRTGTASILGAQTIGEKLMNAARYAAAGAKEATSKTELAMIERQILGFKEEFGLEMYPVFESMEDNEGWLPTDRKVRALYDQCREDIADMVKAKAEKQEQIKRLDGLEGSGLTPPTVPVVAAQPTPAVVATPVHGGQQQPPPPPHGQMPWASTAQSNQAGAYGSSYGSSQQASHGQYGGQQYGGQQYGGQQYGGTMQQQSQPPQQHEQQPNQSGFAFMGGQSKPEISPQASWNSGSKDSMTSSYSTTAQAGQQHINTGQVFDPFDGIGVANSNSSAGGPPPPSANNNAAFDPFAGLNQNNGSNSQLSNADMNLFKY
eukprot:scaffold16018_cov120-Skeletonema_dohrnii-CCMP3373.AAC.1